MQHLDEGTIHAWLDGALTADEAARVEAHVKDCPQCQAAVAEARGFIAASSRILTALDNAPRGVIPAAQPKKRVQPWVWRVAATVLVVAMGSVVLLKERTGSQRTAVFTTGPESTETPATLPFAPPVQILGKKTTAAESAVTATDAVNQNAASTPPAGRAQPPRAFSGAPTPAPVRTRAERDLGANQADGEVTVGERRQAEVAKSRADVSAPVTAASPMMNARTFGALSDVVTNSPREVDKKRTVAATQTFYEIAPGDTVMLEELAHAELQSVVVTGSAAGAAVSRAAQPRALSGKAAAVAEPQQKVDAAAPPPPPPAVMQDARTTEIHRISWQDPSTGRVLVLSGRHSQEELQEIRKKIQQLRDPASRSKKTPD